MRESTRNFMVGLFVLLALSLLAVMMVWFGETPRWLQRGEWTLRIVGVAEIRGIGEGSPVYLNGVEIGRVSTLSFQDPEHPNRGVIIFARVKRGYSVPYGAVAKVYGATLGIGTGRIHITVPRDDTGPLDKDGMAAITGQMASMIGEVVTDDLKDSVQRAVDQFGNFFEATTPVAQNLAGLLERRTVEEVGRPDAAETGVTANLSTAIERFDRLIAHINAVLGDPNVQEDVRTVARDLATASAQIKELVELWRAETRRISENVNDGLDRTDENVQTLLVRLTEAADRLDGAAKDLHLITSKVAAGDGTAGLLVNDPRLYEAAVLSFERFSDFVATLNRIAGKIEEDGYITIGGKTALGTFTKNVPVGPGATAP